MDPIVEAGAAAMIAGYLVALYKHAQPMTSSALLVLVAMVSGIASAFLIAVSAGLVLDAQNGAQTAIQGIIAAAIAAGLTRTDGAAEAKRPDSDMNPANARRL